MSFLTPCPRCERHVRNTESACPFCEASLELAALGPPSLPQKRLTRAATFAFGATLAVTACGGTTDDDDDDDTAGAAGKAPIAATGGSSAGHDSGGTPGVAGRNSSGGTSGRSFGGSAGSGVAGRPQGGEMSIPVYGAPPPGEPRERPQAAPPRPRGAAATRRSAARSRPLTASLPSTTRTMAVLRTPAAPQARPESAAGSRRCMDCRPRRKTERRARRARDVVHSSTRRCAGTPAGLRRRRKTRSREYGVATDAVRFGRSSSPFRGSFE